MKILVPLAQEALSEKIVTEVIQLNERTKEAVDVKLLHVTNPNTAVDSVEVGINLEERMTTEAEDFLTTSRAVLEKAGLKVEVAIREGFAAKEICKEASEAQVDCILIGHHHFTLIQKVTLGSVTAKVVDEAPCPVLVIK